MLEKGAGQFAGRDPGLGASAVSMRQRARVCERPESPEGVDLGSRRCLTSPGSELSDGEIHFLYWFIQGSIMVPETRWRLRRAWGMCERHAWGVVAVEASYRHGFMHGPALFYHNLLERGHAAFDLAGPFKPQRVAWHLRPTGPCMMCDMGYGPATPGAASPDLIECGRDLEYLRAFAEETRAHWKQTACGRCLGDGSLARCRVHLREDASCGDALDPAAHRALLERTFERLSAYAKSSVWGYRHLESEEGRAALITTIGWCSGWRPLIRLVG